MLPPELLHCAGMDQRDQHAILGVASLLLMPYGIDTRLDYSWYRYHRPNTYTSSHLSLSRIIFSSCISNHWERVLQMRALSLARFFMPAGSEMPEVVVIGEGIVRSAHLFLPAALHELEDSKLRLRISALKDHAALVGAAVAWFNNSGSANDSSPHSAATQVDAA
jgi:hypothetical protein